MARVLFCAIAVVSPAAAQVQWLVGPGGHPQIRDVMPFVAPGDTVVVGPGTYYPFRCTKGITLRAQVPGTVTVAFDFFALPNPCGCLCMSINQAATVFQPLPGQTAHVVGLTFAPYWLYNPCLQLFHGLVGVTGGSATFDQCTIDSLVVTAATVHLQDCTVTCVTNSPGVIATNASVTVAGGTIAGCNAATVSVANAAHPGMALTNSRVQASGAVVQGGAPSGTLPGAPGITANGGSLWLVDSTVTAGAGCAVSATGLLRIDRSTLNGGSGSGCAMSPTGAPLVGIDRNGPITIGQVFQVTLASEPNALLLVYGATRLAAPLEVAGLVEQPIWIDPTTLFLADVAIAGPTGQTTFSYPVPAAPQLVGAQFWLQGFGGTSFPLQTSPVVGGLVR